MTIPDIQAIFTTPICLAMFGGCCYQILPILESYTNKKDKPIQVNYRTFFLLIMYAIIGGGVGFAYFHDGQPVNSLLAIQVGASAPLILRALGSSIPRK